MAISYHDWSSATSTTSNWYNYDASSTTGNSITMSSVGASSYRAARPPRPFIVEHPDAWSDQDGIDFVALINFETQTGYTIPFIMRGDVLIVDPDVEVRSMQDFIPLLKYRASGEDKLRINEFIKNHPLTKPETE